MFPDKVTKFSRRLGRSAASGLGIPMSLSLQLYRFFFRGWNEGRHILTSIGCIFALCLSIVGQAHNNSPVKDAYEAKARAYRTGNGASVFAGTTASSPQIVLPLPCLK